MQYRYILTFFLIFILFPFGGKAIFVDVKILSGNNLSAINFLCISGKYAIYHDSTLVAEVYKNNPFGISVQNGKLHLTHNYNNEVLGDYLSLHIKAEGLYNIFKIKPLKPELKEKSFDDELRISVENGCLRLINHVNLENYVAGVVQSEIGGMTDNKEFFKVQSIITRTYALNNILKHFKEGYNLCDATHCQVYFNRCTDGGILQAVSSTYGEVIVDADMKMISAAYHSNSGGETCNSEEVWSLPTTYLKSIQDSFSLNCKNSTWEKKLLKKDFFAYLEAKFNFNLKDSLKTKSIINFSQAKRKQFLMDSIPLKLIRNDYKLKSSYFSISAKGDTLTFIGKGYGHGCGLSQEGALKMVSKGYTYKDIIRFYYQKVDIRKYEDVIKF